MIKFRHENAFNNNLFLFKSIYGVILAKAFNVRPAFLQMLLMKFEQQRKLKETIILNKYDLKWKETSENCKWEHRTR